MIPAHRFQDALAAVLALLVWWACFQVAAPYGIPLPLAGTVGGVLALVIALARVRERARGGTDPLVKRPTSLDLEARSARVLLLVIVTVALALRAHTLLSRTTWADEMWTLRNIYTANWSELFRVAFDDYWPPLDYVVLNAVARIANTGLLWLRSPSMLFGTATVALMYPLGQLLFQNRVAALAGATLLAGMTSHVLYSQEARVYAMLVLLAVASAYYFYRSYWDRRISLGFLATTILLTYAHSFSSWYFIAGECAYVVVAWLIWRDREAFRKGVLSQAIVLAAWLPLVAAFLYSRISHGIVVPTAWATGLDTSPGWMDVVELYQGLAVRSWAGAAFMTLLLAVAVVPRLGSWGRAGDPGPPRKAIWFLLCWVTVPMAFSLVVSVATSLHTFGSTRYHLTVLPGLCLLAAAGLTRIRSRAAMLGAWCSMLLLPTAELPRYYRGIVRPAWDEAAAIVKARGSPRDRIYLGGDFRAFAYYYRGIFPRIGSSQWDSLAKAHAPYSNLSTTASGRWGDTYAYEKISPQIRRFHDFPDTTPPVRNELEHLGLTGAYWIILDIAHDQPFMMALDATNMCHRREVYHVRGLELRHCKPQGKQPLESPSPTASSALGLDGLPACNPADSISCPSS